MLISRPVLHYLNICPKFSNSFSKQNNNNTINDKLQYNDFIFIDYLGYKNNTNNTSVL